LRSSTDPAAGAVAVALADREAQAEVRTTRVIAVLRPRANGSKVRRRSSTGTGRQRSSTTICEPAAMLAMSPGTTEEQASALRSLCCR
jgi:hypothetical protein